MRGDVGRDLDLAAGRAPAKAGTKVASSSSTQSTASRHPGPFQCVPARRGLASEVRRVPVAHPLERARLRQSILGELADRLEQAVPRARRRVVGDDERLADQRVEVFEDVDLVVAVDDREDARQVEAAGEHRRGAQQVTLVVGQQVVGPGDRVAQRLLAIRAAGAIPSAAGSDRRAGP